MTNLSDRRKMSFIVFFFLVLYYSFYIFIFSVLCPAPCFALVLKCLNFRDLKRSLKATATAISTTWFGMENPAPEKADACGKIKTTFMVTGLTKFAVLVQ